MNDLKTKQAFWAEQLPIFKEKYWIPGHLEALEFDMNGGCFDIAEGVKTDLSEEDLFDRYHRVNSGWAMWIKAVNVNKPQWQPIETAPKDRDVLLRNHEGIFQGKWDEKSKQFHSLLMGYHGCGCCAGEDPQPTQWMELPLIVESGVTP
ncbi:hypothetical protein [Acinetobacter pittii]|uniref:hypothetical protein n=1 Tax=Acinetobacter pittii TaxID=48296 RepID=UPI000A8CD0D4|nr:hypothetical protein [Acinetobacter pittii]